jgi:hypothetical protein
MSQQEDSYYPFERLAIRLSTNMLIIEGLYWLSSRWGVFERINGDWVEYQSDADSIEAVTSDLYMHVNIRHLADVTESYDGWKEIESTLDEPLDYSYCEEFKKSYEFEDIVPEADGYPALNSFYDIYRWSRNFVDGYFDGLNDPLYAGGHMGASERDTQYQEILRYQSERLDYEATIKRRRVIPNAEAEAEALSLAESHPILLDQVARIHDAAYLQYSLEYQRLNIDDDWAMFYPTIKYVEFLEGKTKISTRELLEVGDYFAELVLHRSRSKNGLKPIQDPRPTSEWYRSTMNIKSEVAEPDNMVSIRLCKCGGEPEHTEFINADYAFPDGSIENLPTLCFENELYPADLDHQFRPILKTLESDENWTMNSYFAGVIAQVRPGLYFYSFGDVDEIGERNFFIKSDLRSVVHMLLREWGPSASRWEALLRNVGSRGYPGGYEPGTTVNLSVLMPNTGEETLTIGFSYNMEHKELHEILRELDL